MVLIAWRDPRSVEGLICAVHREIVACGTHTPAHDRNWHDLPYQGGQSGHALPGHSDLDLLGYGKRIVDLDTQIADGAFDLGMAEEQLEGTQISGAAIDKSCLGSPQRMRPKKAWVQSNVGNPHRHKPGILPGCHAPIRVMPVSELKLAWLLVSALNITIHRLACLLAEFEPYRHPRFLLADGRTINSNPMRCDGLDLEADDITAPEFAVDGKIEHGQIAFSAFDLWFGPD
jgi:hypothetical protein